VAAVATSTDRSDRSDRSDRLMLLDAASLYYRAYFGVPESLTAPDGTPVNAVRGLLDFVARLVTDRSPTRLVACWDDDWRPAWRVAALPSYKAHRVAAERSAAPDVEETPDTLAPQVPVIVEVLAALGIARVGAPGYEADDVIGTIVARADCPVDVVTGDRDLFQLVDDAARVRVLYTARGVGKHEVVDEAAVRAKYGIPARAYADFALLRGDPSDGLPGVPGVGDKTAASLITRFGGLEGLLAALDADDRRLSVAERRRLEGARNYLAVAPPVVRVASDAPLPTYDDRLPSAPRDPESLLKLADRWGLAGPLDRVVRAFTAARTPSP
jgi:5'-3' exonuclease